jgi:hypothetical protein
MTPRALAHALERLDEISGREPRDADIASVETLDELEQSEPRTRQ